ncbi:hypothetical protein M419DRAFT_121937 [Trichoderma reesei RUT C-30]|uniref:Uncharacterized protein n=1 Tax=Hypocrea jecorina (strain ATCC 56765 / BCRC 32924 / NRRL 11460 / Rut C-30) TaxID=1344414 RepID=A0A024SKY6_HYPJR|nr:hypothetical protein M419DRAFT_121937 [Trichoderma reesei RUT C-30]
MSGVSRKEEEERVLASRAENVVSGRRSLWIYWRLSCKVERGWGESRRLERGRQQLEGERRW